MTIHLEDKWIWDFWFARDGSDIHIFYLQAPRSIGNPDQRHWRSTIGHAVSQDLVNWEILPDALRPSDDEKAWDSLTTWTGSVLNHHGSWYMFYTGTSKSENGLIQRIGLATSDDLLTWRKYAANPLIKIDSLWYELLDKKIWYEQTWRDPWVFEYDGNFHAFITARANQDLPNNRGVVGHACSQDLMHWETLAPITNPGEFAYLEVPQLVNIDQFWYLVFCVESKMFSEDRFVRKGSDAASGTHYMMAENPLGPFFLPDNDLLFGDKKGSFYSGKLIKNNAGEWNFMTAVQFDPMKGYVGDISDPMPLIVDGEGHLSVMQ